MSKSSCDLLLRKRVLFGNNVSHSNIKSRRSFYPNISKGTFFSDILGINIHLNVCSSAKKKLSSESIDSFLLRKKQHQLSPKGVFYKKCINKKLRNLSKKSTDKHPIIASIRKKITDKLNKNNSSSLNKPLKESAPSTASGK